MCQVDKTQSGHQPLLHLLTHSPGGGSQVEGSRGRHDCSNPTHLEGHQTLGASNTSYAEGPLPHGDGAVGAERPEDRCVPRDTLPHPGEEELNVFCEGLHVGFELRGVQKTQGLRDICIWALGWIPHTVHTHARLPLCSPAACLTPFFTALAPFYGDRARFQPVLQKAPLKPSHHSPFLKVQGPAHREVSR